MVARDRSGASRGDPPWQRNLLPIAFTVLMTGIGLSCVMANVLDGYPTVFTLP